MTDAVNNKGMPNAAEVVNTEVLHSVVTEMQLPAYQWPGVAGDWLPPPFGTGRTMFQLRVAMSSTTSIISRK